MNQADQTTMLKVMANIDPRTVTGTDSGLLEDTPQSDTPMIVTQIEEFLKNDHGMMAYPLASSLLEKTKGTVWEKYAENMLNDIDLAVIYQVDCEVNRTKKEIGGDSGNYADVYRIYSKTLREISNAGRENSELAKQCLADLFAEQTLPGNDLETPYFVDGYTGEEIPEPDDKAAWQAIHEHDANGVAALPDVKPEDPLIKQSKSIAEDLGWTEEVREQFVQAQTSGLGIQEEVEEVIPDDDRGFVPETLTKDFQLNMSVLSEAFSYLSAFNKIRTRIFASMRKENEKRTRHNMLVGIKQKKIIKGAMWYHTFRATMIKRPEFKALIDEIAALRKEGLMYSAIVYLKVAGQYGLQENDIDQETLRFSNENHDELSEIIMNMDMGRKGAHVSLETWEQLNYKEWSSTMPRFSHNPLQTRSWNIAYAKAIAAGATLKQAEETAWAAFRRNMSKKAAAAYEKVLSDTGSKSRAMASFWKACPRHVPKPRQTIVTYDKGEFVLNTGRRITPNILRAKLIMHEIEIPEGQYQKLHDLLTRKNLGWVVAALEKNYKK